MKYRLLLCPHVKRLISLLFFLQFLIGHGIAIGSASHAVGTAKAMELGEIEGAMSSLSIAVSGILTVVAAMVYANLL